MTELSERICFTLDQELGGGEVPAEVQLLPAGEVRPKGKTGFTVDEEAKRLIMAAFSGSSTDLVVDYEHQSLSGSEAPAAGWIKELVDKDEEGLWAKVQWTERAKEYLKGREYRYLSPVVLVRKKDGRAVELLGAGLTNLPAIDGMAPVVNTALQDPGDTTAQKEKMYEGMYQGVLKALGLPEETGIDEVEAMVSALKAPAGFVPATEYNALRDALKDQEADGLVREAVADGRLTPSLTAWAKAYALRDMDGLKEFLGKAAPVVPLHGLAIGIAPAIEKGQRDVNRMLGIKDEFFFRYDRASS